MVGGESSWVDGVGVNPVGGRPQAPAVHLLRAAEALQQEWAFVQQVNPGIGETFGLAEQVLQKTFILALFQGLR